MLGLWTRSSFPQLRWFYPSPSQHTELSPKSPPWELTGFAGFDKISSTRDVILMCRLGKCNIFLHNNPILGSRQRLAALTTAPGRNSPSAGELPLWSAMIFPSSWLSWALPLGQPAATSSYFLICCLNNPSCGVCNCPDPCYTLPGCPK